MRLYGIKTRIIKTGDDLTDILIDSLKNQSFPLKDNDVIAFTSKIVSQSQGRTVKLTEITPSEEGKKLGKMYRLRPELAELILREADTIYGGVEKAILTLKDGVLAPNAGMDIKNVPADQVILWPAEPRKTAENIKHEIRRRCGRNVAILITDSSLTPLRIGTVGLALAVAGFRPIKDFRCSSDLYGKSITTTREAVADNLASAAHLLMGEGNEQTPMVVIREAPVDFNDESYDSGDMTMPFEGCIFMNAFLSRFRHRSDSQSEQLSRP